MPSSHLIFCRPLLLLPPIPPSIRVFSNESTLRMRRPKYWSLRKSFYTLSLSFLWIIETMKLTFPFPYRAEKIKWGLCEILSNTEWAHQIEPVFSFISLLLRGWMFLSLLAPISLTVFEPSVQLEKLLLKFFFLATIRTVNKISCLLSAFHSVQFSLVAQLCLTLCDPMNSSTPGLLVHHQLLEFTQTHVHWVVDAIQPSHPLSSLLLLPPIPPSIRVFSSESTLSMRWPKYWSFSFSISPSNEHPGLISFRMDWLDLLAVQGTLRSLLQYHSSKASILWRSAFFTVQFSHPYMTTGKTIALTRWIFLAK